ncbi:MAG TPA: DsrE family protein [Chitinophagaceae bacterium]|nr:DsrE family protein [Chitinophagaceae bacterium]
MKRSLLAFLLFGLTTFANAQPSQPDSTHLANIVSKAKSKAFKDSLEKLFASKAIYPLIKASKWSGVIPVNNADEKPDINQQYKLLMEVTTGIGDSAKEINEAIAEVGRLLNIHIAAGIPQNNINIIVIAHGPALKSFYTNTAYKEKFKVDNPNIILFNELLAAGVKFIACGQAMAFQNINKDQLLPWVKIALSAQTVLTNYQLKGYIYKKIVVD